MSCAACHVEMVEERGPLAPGGPVGSVWVCQICKIERMRPDPEPGVARAHVGVLEAELDPEAIREKLPAHSW